MTGSALLTFIATILAAESGSIEIDLGRQGGLRPGDQGVVFYEVVLDDRVEKIDIGSASVVEVSDFTARLEIPADLEARPGFLVRIDLPRSRLTSSDPLDLEPVRVPETVNQSVALESRDSATAPSVAYVVGTGGRCLRLRSSPDRQSAVLACVPEGTAVTVLQEGREWSQSRLDNADEGWLASRYLSALPPQAEPSTAPEPRTSRGQAVLPTPEPSLEAPLSADLERLLEELEHTESLVEVQLRQLSLSHAAFLEAQETRAELSRRILEATVSEFESKLAIAKDEYEESERARLNLAERYDRLEADFGANDADLARVEAERNRLRTQLEATTSELVQIEAIANTAKEALRKEVQATETTVAALRGRLEQREKELAETQTRLEGLNARQAGTPSGPGSVEEASKSSLARDLEQATTSLLETQREKEALEIWLEERNRELSQAEAKVAIMQSEIDRLEVIAPRKEREIEIARAQLDDAQRRAAELESRLATGEDGSALVETQPKPPRSSPPAAPAAARVFVLGSAKPCLNFRTEPKANSEAFDCLEPGTALGALGHWQDWQYVELADGRAGWVVSRHLGPAIPAGSGL